MNSFELDLAEVNGSVYIDREYYKIKEEQFKQVFSEMDFLGWYSTGEGPSEQDVDVHKQICEISDNESPLFLQLNPVSGRPADLPIAVFESVIDIVGGEARMLFVKLAYTLATEEVIPSSHHLLQLELDIFPFSFFFRRKESALITSPESPVEEASPNPWSLNICSSSTVPSRCWPLE